jgi:hypothetical protein
VEEYAEEDAAEHDDDDGVDPAEHVERQRDARDVTTPRTKRPFPFRAISRSRRRPRHAATVRGQPL